MATLSRLLVYPIKSLDPVALDRASITEIGGLELDRAYAVVDEDGEYVNGKRTPAVHRLRAGVDPDTRRIVLGERDDPGGTEFHLDRDREGLAAWLSAFLGFDVTLEAGPGGSGTDGVVYGDGTRAGPTIVAAGTLREVASWYDGIDAGEMRARLRPNLVVEGVPAFWEDRLVAGEGRRLRVGDATLVGVKPVPRCVVPARDPRTGEEREGFADTFREGRAETFPGWGDPEAFGEDYYKATTLTRIPDPERDAALSVGDEVHIVDAPD